MCAVHQLLGTALELTELFLQGRHSRSQGHINGQQGLIQVPDGAADVGADADVHRLHVPPHRAHAIAKDLRIGLQLEDALVVGLARSDHSVDTLLKLLHAVQEGIQRVCMGT